MTYMKKTFLPDSTEWAKLMERMSEQDKNVSSHLSSVNSRYILDLYMDATF